MTITSMEPPSDEWLFVDTYYYVALLNPADQHHAVCVEFIKQIKEPLVATEWVLLELANTLSNPAVRMNVSQFLMNLHKSSGVKVIPATSEWFNQGLRLYSSRADKSRPLTDCISMKVMESLEIGTVLSGDKHFTQAGFHAVFAVHP